LSKEIFTQIVKQLREQNNLTTRELAELIGVSHASITYYEQGKREATISVLEAYADYFKVSTDFLLGR
jgi:transcriptional regulator with XRE-family HTH domain